MMVVLKQYLLRFLMQRMAMGVDSNPVKPDAPRRIALWQFGGLGDMLLATPVIRALQHKWPDAEIHIYCSHPQFAGFLRRFPSVKAVHSLPIFDFDTRTLLQRDVRRRLGAIRDEMRAVASDVLVNLHIPALLDWWAVEWWLIRQLNVPFALGFNPRFMMRNSAYDVSLNACERDDIHYTTLYRQLLEKAAIACDERSEFPLTAAERDKATALLMKSGDALVNPVCLHIGGRRLQMENRMWPVECFAALAEKMITAGFSLVLIGVQDECAMGEALFGLLPASMRGACVNFIGHTTMGEMAALIEASGGFIGHDSGPFHIAAAVGTPCVAICGRPDAEPEYLNYERGDVRVLTADSPDLIAVDDVFAAAMREFGA